MANFVTIEGPEGAGKGSLLSRIKSRVEGKNWLFTKEPGSPEDDICVSLREVILNPENNINSEAEIYLYLADRCQHVMNFVKPNLDAGKNILCDRYIDSTFAYQCFGLRGGTPESIEKINTLNKYATFNLIPNVTIILQVDPEVGLSRATQTEFGKKDRIEQRKLDFHKRVCEGYQYLIDNPGDRDFICVDTTHLDCDEVYKEVIIALEKRGVL